ncbi:MAG: SurA N-terminal domain-containing protein [Xanthomonadales bacterium]|nr:SurA N-terminal domain-containing protein [Xanthomonadales bacterium]
MVLQSIRERLTGILAFAILGILVVPFALVGVNQYFTSSSQNIVARINDTEITTNDFNQSFSNYRRRMQSLMGEAYNPVEFDQLTVRRQHLDDLIDQELLTQAALDMGLDVDDETLATEIRRIPAFQVDGEFNVDVYQARLQAQGMTPKRFQNEMRAQFIVTQLPRNISASSIATASEINDFIALVEQERTFNVALVPAKTDELVVEFTDEQVSAWYENHNEDYMSEEQVIIEYVELDAGDIDAGPPPDDAMLREQFEAQKARFVSPEQRLVSHILLEVSPDADEAEIETARQTAEDLAKRARAGEDFAQLAREYSQDQGSAAEGGDLGWVEPGVMVEAFETAMYELSLDSPISDPVQTAYGWHVIDLRDIRESTGMTFEEAKATLVNEYQDDAAARIFLDRADELVDLVYEDPTTLESAAMVMGLQVHEAGPFPRSGGEGIAANPEVIQTAFSDLVLLQGSVSDPINLDENRLVMIKLKKHLPAAIKPIDEVRDEIVATLRDNMARDLARTQAEELLATALDGEASLETLAADAGLDYSSHEAVKRNTQVPDAMLVQEVFRLGKPVEGKPVDAVLPTSGGFAVVELTEVKPGEFSEENAQFMKLQVERAVANGVASQEASALMRQLRTAADVQVYEQRITN